MIRGLQGISQDWDLAVYKETLKKINVLLKAWREEDEDDVDDYDFLYQIEGLVDEVGLDE
tara:strand:- start:694 stop:873 length:180 start_codon:yes stop_codon:yes gene_type:complete